MVSVSPGWWWQPGHGRRRIWAGDAQGALLPLLPTYWSARVFLKLGSGVGSTLGPAHQGCCWVVAPSLQLGE